MCLHSAARMPTTPLEICSALTLIANGNVPLQARNRLWLFCRCALFGNSCRVTLNTACAAVHSVWEDVRVWVVNYSLQDEGVITIISVVHVHVWLHAITGAEDFLQVTNVMTAACTLKKIVAGYGIIMPKGVEMVALIVHVPFPTGY